MRPSNSIQEGPVRCMNGLLRMEKCRPRQARGVKMFEGHDAHLCPRIRHDVIHNSGAASDYTLLVDQLEGH